MEPLFTITGRDEKCLAAGDLPPIGRPSAPVPEILRSLVLMSHLKEESIDTWVDWLRGDDLLAVICGFVPGQIPGVGTFYDLLDRFWLGEKPCRIRKAREEEDKAGQR